MIAKTGLPVGSTSYKWPSAPDGAACLPTVNGGWIYVENSEVSGGNGGVGAIRFLSDGSIADASSS